MPHAAAMVGHGGFGTTLAGMAAGVPMVVVPLFADQPYNAARVEAIAAGVALEGGPAAIGGLADALRQVLDGDWYRAGAQRIAEQIARLPPAADAVPMLEEIAGRRGRRQALALSDVPGQSGEHGVVAERSAAICHAIRRRYPPATSSVSPPTAVVLVRRTSAGALSGLSFPPSGQHQRSWPRGEEPARGFRHLNQAVDIGGAAARPQGQRPGLRKAYLAKWMRIWVALLCVVTLVVVGYLTVITNSLANVNGNLGTVSREVGAVRAPTPSSLPSHVDTINASLGKIDAALKPIPDQAGTHRGRPLVDQRQAHGRPTAPWPTWPAPSRPCSARWAVSATS